MALLGQKSQRSSGHRLRRHIGKSTINLVAPVHTPRRWGWLHNRVVPAVLRVGPRAARNPPHHAQASGSLIVSVAPKATELSRRATNRYRTPFLIACRNAIRLSLPQAKILNRRRQGLGLVALAVARDLCGIPLKAVVIQDFAIGC